MLSGRNLRWFQTAMCCCGFLLLGYDQGVMSGIIGATNQFGKDFDEPSDLMQGLITSIYDVGCAAGALITFFIADRLGRKKMILMGGTTMIIGTIILGTSFSRAQLIVGRIVTGVGNGFNCATIPLYQSETASPRIRGALVCLQSTMTILGLVIAYYLDIGFSYIDGPAQWRFPISFQALFAVFLVLMVWFVPDTPRWLLEMGRSNEAHEVIARIHGLPLNDSQVLLQRDEIASAIEHERIAGAEFTFRELFAGGKTGNWRRVCLACGVLVMQQATGANMINYYVYQNTIGVSREVSLQLGGGTALTYFAASFICLVTVDRYGRRALLMFASGGLAFCFFMTAVLVAVSQTRTGAEAKAMGAAGASFVFLFQVFLGIGWLGIPFLYPTEVTTTRIRSRAAALGTVCNWLAVFVVVMITPTAVTRLGWRVFLIFGSFNLAFIPIVYCFFPETAGLTLEEVDMMFERGGATGGVFSTRGKTVVPGSGRLEVRVDEGKCVDVTLKQ